jgi:hypothetical protein
LTVLREKVKIEGRELHAAFVDLKKAFPSVNRQRLLNELSGMGVSDQFLRILTRLYSGDTFSVLLDGKPGTRKFQVGSGVHEGSPLSPLLFILFIAGLVDKLKATGADRLGVKLEDGSWLCCMLYADDVLLISTTRDGLQELINQTCCHFSSLGLTVNPGKSDIVIFDRGRRANPRHFDIASISKMASDESKYLGVIFHRGGKWQCQLETTLTRCRMARGRCHIICSSLNLTSARSVVQIFDTFVSSIYRYSLGTWGVTAGSLFKIDNLFCDYVRRQFRLPPKSCRRGILMQFGRRCAHCDARFLAIVQLARGLTNPNSVWGKVIKTVWSRTPTPWVKEVRGHMRAMGIDSEVFRDPAGFLSDRKEWGLKFARWCHNQHFVFANGRSSDRFRLDHPYGMFPAVYDLPADKSRVLLTFVLSCWRWAFELRDIPDYCVTCDSMMNSWHVMFQCSLTSSARESFRDRTGKIFEYEAFRDCTLNYEVVRALNDIVGLLRHSLS